MLYIYKSPPQREAKVIEGMLEIRAEGEILGCLCFEELSKHLLANYPDWNHSVGEILGNLCFEELCVSLQGILIRIAAL